MRAVPPEPPTELRHWPAPVIALTLLLTLGNLLHFAAATEESAPASVETLVERLNHPDYEVRRQAVAKLWQRDDQARGLLEDAAASPDPETAARAALLLERLRLGIEPTVPDELIAPAVEARRGSNAMQRAAARQNLADSAVLAAPVIAQLIVDAHDGRLDEDEEPAVVLRDLWPSDREAVPRIVAELLERQATEATQAWFRTAAIDLREPLAAANLAAFTARYGALDPLHEQWQEQHELNPSSLTRRMLAAASLAANSVPDDWAAQEGTQVLPLAHSVLAGDLDHAQAQAKALRDPVRRLTCQLLLAQLKGDADMEKALREEAKQLLVERAKVLDVPQQAPAPARPARPDEPDAEHDATATALRHAAVLAVVAGEVQIALELAERADAAAALFVLYRRFDFDAANELYRRHQRPDDPQFREVRVVLSYLQRELRPVSRGSRQSPELSQWSAQHIEAVEAYRDGQYAKVVAQLDPLLEVDPYDPSLQWLYAVARERLTGDDPTTAPATPTTSPMVGGPQGPVLLADPKLREELAEDIWMAGEAEAVVEQYRQAAQWATALPADAAQVMLSYTRRASELKEFEESARAATAGLGMLLWDEASESLPRTWLYHAMFLRTKVMQARLNQAIEAGDYTTAEALWREAGELLPSQTELAIDLVVALDTAGEKRSADRIFSDSFNRLAVPAAKWPQSAQLSNQAAWLAASCGRRLDTALTLAQTAVASDPTSAAALDTLAEVHLRRGDTKTALDMMDRVVALAEEDDTLPIYVVRRAEFHERANNGDENPSR